MRTKLNKELLEKLYSENKSYKEIAEITGYNENSVNGYFWRTKGKMKEVGKFRRNTIDISQEQREILFGTLMGDGNIQKQKTHSYTGRYNHALNQEIYCKYVKKNLGLLAGNIKYSQRESEKFPGRIYYNCYFSLKNNYNLREFYEMFYIGENNKRDVPYNLELLTPRAMAYMFMDDGTASSKCSISIALCSFSFEGLTRLKEFLYKTYSIEIIIKKDFKIYFKAESARKFYHLTKEYIIPEMMYKFKFINPSVHVKLGELLETPEVDNQQPS